MSHDVHGRDQRRSRQPRSYAEPIAVVLLLLAIFAIYVALGVHEARKDRERDAVVMANVDTLAAIVVRTVRHVGEYPMSFRADEDTAFLPQGQPLLNPFTGRRSEPSHNGFEPGAVFYTALYSSDGDSAAAPSGCVIQGYGTNGTLLKMVLLPYRGHVLIDESQNDSEPDGLYSSGGDLNAL